MARIRDESNAQDDAKLIAEHRRAPRIRNIDEERRAEERTGWSITGRTGAQRDGHPDGFKSSR